MENGQAGKVVGMEDQAMTNYDQAQAVLEHVQNETRRRARPITLAALHAVGEEHE